jgi:hypothetical protein
MLAKAKVRFNSNFHPLVGDKKPHCLAVGFFDIYIGNSLLCYVSDNRRVSMKKLITRSIYGLFTAVVAFSSSVVFAQWIGPPVLVQQPLVDVVELNRFAAKTDTSNRQFSPRNTRPENVASRVSLVYQPSLERRKINLANFVKKSRATDPVGAAEMARLFASTDIIGAIGQAIASAGLKVNNVADAYSVYWTSAWNASRGSTKTPTKAQMTSIKGLVANAISATPAFASASETQKQEYAEALLIQAALIDAAVEKAGSDPVQLKAVAKAVRQGAKASGFDLDSMILTKEGFVLSGNKTGVADTNDDTQLASILNESETPSTPNYALIAAAGGAGLGGMFLLGKAMGRKN